MLTRRDLVLGGAVGALSSAAVATPAAAGKINQAQDDQEAANILRRIQPSLVSIDQSLATAFESNSLAQGQVPKLRQAFTTFLRANSKFPDYCEIGMNVFYDLYDWHVKHKQPVQIGRVLENRLAIDFMFTHLIVRAELEPNHIGVPFDRI